MKTEKDMAAMKPNEFWNMVRHGEWRLPTISPCHDYLRAGLCIIKKEFAVEFLIFCQRNPKPLPIIDITDVGSPHPFISPDADLRTDLPKYNILINGELKEQATDINRYWQDDFICFLIGCGIGLDNVLNQHKIDFISPHAIHTSNIRCKPAGMFKGPMAVTCRLFKNMSDIARAIPLSAHLPECHGTPVHIGDPSLIGINNVFKGDVVTVPELNDAEKDRTPVFWACGCTLDLIAKESNIPLMITQSPAHMFITDRLIQELNG